MLSIVAFGLIFPKYQEASKTGLTPLSKARAFLKVAENSFNYNVLGVNGFDALGALIDASDCYEFKYSHLDEALALFAELAH